MKNLVIIKLGGSVITDKKTNKPTFRKAVVKRICKEIYEAKNKLGFDLILIHGAGSFGHPPAKKYKLPQGFVGNLSSKGISLTKYWMLKLNLLIISEMIKTGLNPCLVESSAVIKMSSGKIKTFDTDAIKISLSKNLVPVMSGDVAFDDQKGISIISGDAISTYLAKKLGAKKVIFLSDVDGIFDKNPKVFRDAQLIRKINNKNYKTIIKDIKIHNPTDITGEMKGKISAIKKDLKGIKALIVNGFTPGNMLKSLHDQNSTGTLIYFS